MAMQQGNATLLEMDETMIPAGARVAVVGTEWNQPIVAGLREGFTEIITRYSGSVAGELTVPGAFELPFGCRTIWRKLEGSVHQPEAIVAFGVVIRGGTPHFEYVCKAVTDGILQLNLILPVPVVFGVLTLDTEQQAWERIGGTHGHKGAEAAITALKMVALSRGVRYL